MSKFFLKTGYNIELNNKYYHDCISNLTYQPHVYDLANYISETANIDNIIDVGCGSGEKLKQFNKNIKIIGVDSGDNLSLFQNNLQERKIEVIDVDLLSKKLTIDSSILENSIVICSDVIEHLPNPTLLVDTLAKWSNLCKYLIISTPARDKIRGVADFGPPANKAHSMEWTLDELYAFLSSRDFPIGLHGYTINDDFHGWKTTSLIISGREAVYIKQEKVPVTAIINCYNESDIIESVILYLIKQDINVFVVDNWSTDGSYEIVSKLSEKYQSVTITRFPDSPSSYYNWNEQLINTVKISEKLGYGWYLHYDADEIRESPWLGINLREAISFVDSLGYNAIDFTLINFRYVKDDNNYSHKSLIERLRYWNFGEQSGDFKQTKGWKYFGQSVNLNYSGGHNVNFEGRKVYPFKFLTRHYPLRSPEQARQKLFRDRFPRFRSERQKLGWHNHYDYITEKQLEGWDQRYLFPWHPLGFSTEYLVERISCIGISPSKPQAENSAVYQQAIEAQTNNPRLYFMLAKTQRDEGYLEKAIASSKKALELDPDSVDIVEQLSKLLVEVEQDAEALSLVKSLLKSQPNNPRLYLTLGKLQRRQKNLEAAVLTYQKTIELIPHKATPYIHLGNLLIQGNRIKEAIGNCKQALKLHPQNSQIYFILGKAYAKQKDLEQAISCYQQAIQLNYKNAGAYFALGQVLREQKKLAEAMVAYQSAIELQPEYFQSYIGLGHCYRQQKRWEKALSCYQQAIELNCQNAGAYYALGQVLREQGNWEQAIANYRQALELNHPNPFGVYKGLGDALTEINEIKQAISAYQQAMAIEPNNPKIKKTLQKIN